MISAFDSADEAITKSIKDLCRELDRTNVWDEDHAKIVDAITKLRSSLNAPVISKDE